VKVNIANTFIYSMLLFTLTNLSFYLCIIMTWDLVIAIAIGEPGHYFSLKELIIMRKKPLCDVRRVAQKSTETRKPS